MAHPARRQSNYANASRAIRRATIVIQQPNGNSPFSEDVALFIDWENFKISLADRGRTPNVSALKEEVAHHGRVVVGKAYADWVSRSPELKGASQFILDPPSLYAAGIEPVYVPTRLPPRGGSYQPGRTMRIKNSVDVKMTADCIETAHSFPNINTFVLVSGDSDFIHVINSLRAVGKRVLVVGVSWATSRRMADHVDGLIFYDSDVDPITAPEPTYRSRSVAPAPLSNPGRHQLPEVIRAIEDVIRAERAAGHTLLLTSLKQRLMRRIPGFDERKLGFSGFKKLMLRVADEGNIKIRSVDLVDWILMANEPDPEPRDQDDDAVDLPEADSESDSEAGADFRSSDDETSDADAVAAVDATPSPNGVIPPPAPASEPEPAAAPPPPRSARSIAPDAADARSALDAAFRELEPASSDDAPGALERVADLVVMGHTLEERDGADAVMFNALCNEVSQALSAAIAAADPAVTPQWGEHSSKTYITRLVRSLTAQGVFQYRTISVRDAETNRLRRRRVFGLNRLHPLTDAALAARLGPAYAAAAATGPAADPSTPASGNGFASPDADAGPTNDAVATPPLDGHHSAEADRPETADEAEAAAIMS